MKLRAYLYALSGLVWLALPAVAAAAGLVPCDGTACNICNLGQLLQNIVNFLIGISFPIAAVLFAWAGWLYYSNNEDTYKVERAHKIFTTVFIGFAIVVGGWLIVQTALKTLAPGYQSWTTFDCRTLERPTNTSINQLLEESGIGQVTVPVYVQSGDYGCAAGWDYIPDYNQCIKDGQVVDAVRTGDISFNAYNGDIDAAINGYQEVSTAAGPYNGNRACAWAVNNVLNSAGVPSIDGDSVALMEAELKDGGRGTYVDPSQAQAGDIIVWKDDSVRVSHVGFCTNAGCTQTISNSSSAARFNNTSLGQVFNGVQGRVYRVNK